MIPGAWSRKSPRSAGDPTHNGRCGWSRYFFYGTHRSVFRGIDYYAYERVRDFLARRHKIHGRGTRRFSYDVVYGERGVSPLRATIGCTCSNTIGLDFSA
jgi:hypothetical protein